MAGSKRVALDRTRKQDVCAPVIRALEPLKIGCADDESAGVVSGGQEKPVKLGIR